MSIVAHRLIENRCILSEEVLELTGSYLIEATLSVVPSQGGFCYLKRKIGAPYCSESYYSRTFESELEAAIAALKDYNIVNINERGDAVFRPTRDNSNPTTCTKCKFYSSGVSFCAVNPSMFGRPSCPDHESVLEFPKQKINNGSPLTKALKAAGL